eukprot:15261974-Heterocapsa_arctica.AAC.1
MLDRWDEEVLARHNGSPFFGPPRPLRPTPGTARCHFGALPGIAQQPGSGLPGYIPLEPRPPGASGTEGQFERG